LSAPRAFGSSSGDLVISVADLLDEIDFEAIADHRLARICGYRRPERRVVL
jgi:hypothetical protein